MNIKAKEIAKKLLDELPKRSQDILIKRYGLGKVAKRETLEGIGREYKITRERVRQIESFALNLIKKSDEFLDCLNFFDLEVAICLIRLLSSLIGYECGININRNAQLCQFMFNNLKAS